MTAARCAGTDNVFHSLRAGEVPMCWYKVVQLLLSLDYVIVYFWNFSSPPVAARGV